jgi:hypothetical protein
MSICWMRKSLISGGGCIVAQALHTSAPHGHWSITDARFGETDLRHKGVHAVYRRYDCLSKSTREFQTHARHRLLSNTLS